MVVSSDSSLTVLCDDVDELETLHFSPVCSDAVKTCSQTDTEETPGSDQEPEERVD